MLNLYKLAQRSMATWNAFTKDDAWPLIKVIISSPNLQDPADTANVQSHHPMDMCTYKFSPDYAHTDDYEYSKNIARRLCSFLTKEGINALNTNSSQYILFKDCSDKNQLISRLKKLAPENQTLSLPEDDMLEKRIEKLEEIVEQHSSQIMDNHARYEFVLGKR